MSAAMVSASWNSLNIIVSTQTQNEAADGRVTLADDTRAKKPICVVVCHRCLAAHTNFFRRFKPSSDCVIKPYKATFYTFLHKRLLIKIKVKFILFSEKYWFLVFSLLFQFTHWILCPQDDSPFAL